MIVFLVSMIILPFHHSSHITRALSNSFSFGMIWKVVFVTLGGFHIFSKHALRAIELTLWHSILYLEDVLFMYTIVE